MKHTRRDFVLGGSAAAALPVLSLRESAGATPGSGQSEQSRRDESRTSRPPLTIAALLPLSGYLGAAGRACLEGLELAARLLPGRGLPRLRIIPADIGESPETALAAAEQSLQSHPRMLIGSFDSALTEIVATFAERQRIPLIVNVAAAPSITRQGYRFVFRIFPDAERIVRNSYALQLQLFAATGFTPRKLVLIHINNGRGIQTVGEIGRQMRLPYALAEPVAYDPKALDLSAEVARARATGADALWTVSRMDDAIRITRELVRQNWTPGVLMSSNASLNDSTYRHALGAYGDYAVTFSPYYDPAKPLSRALTRLQTQLHPGSMLDTAQIYSFEAALIALDARQRAGSDDPSRLVEALRATDLRNNVTVGPGVSFDEHGQNPFAQLTALQNLNGEARIVLPALGAEARPILPMPPWAGRARN